MEIKIQDINFINELRNLNALIDSHNSVLTQCIKSKCNINNNSFIYNQGSTISSNQNTLADELDQKLSNDYIYEVTSTQKKNAAAEDEIYGN